MNRTHIEHIVAAILMMLPFVLLGHLWAGAAFGVAFFAGREHAQAENRYINAHGGRREDVSLPEIMCLESRYWPRDAVLDLFSPAVACVGVAVLVAVSGG